MKEIKKDTVKNATKTLDSNKLSNIRLAAVIALLMLHMQVTLAMSNNEVINQQQDESVDVSNVTQDLPEQLSEAENISRNDENGQIKQMSSNKLILGQTEKDVQQLVSSIKDKHNTQDISSTQVACPCSQQNKDNNSMQENDLQEGTQKEQESINIQHNEVVNSEQENTEQQ